MKKFSFLLLISLSLGARLPETIKKCSKSDANFGDCMKHAFIVGFKTFASGFKPLGIGTLEPTHISELSSEGKGGISQIYRNIEISGLSKCNVNEIKMDWDKLRIIVRASCDHTEVTADYTLKGQMVTFPIDSTGKCKITFDNAEGIHDVQLERFEKGGKKYLRVKDWETKIIPKQVHYDYEDIVPGNPQLSDTILKTLNENGVQIFLDQAAGFEKGFAEIHKIIANKVFEKIPEDDLFLP